MSETLKNTRKARPRVWTFILVPVLLATAFYTGMKVGARGSPESVHGNRDDAVNTPPHDAMEPGTISLTEQAKINIGLTTAVADFRAIDQVVRVPGTVRPHPNRVAFANTRVEGRVEKLPANVGDKVARGQVLAKVQSRRYGNPIPSIDITAPIAGTVIERNVS